MIKPKKIVKPKVKKKPITKMKKVGKVLSGIGKAYSASITSKAQAQRDLINSYKDYE